MKLNSLTLALLAAAVPGLLHAEPKDDVLAAVKKLAEAENYSWTTTVNLGEDSQFRPGPTEGKSLKNGTSHVTFKRGDNTGEVFVRGGKSVVKTDDGWKTPQELAAGNSDGQGQGRGGRGRFGGGMFRNLKAPAVQAEDLAGKTGEFEAKDGAVSGKLNAEAVKSLVTFGGGRRGDGGQAPEPKDASGTIKFWITDGSLTKIETNVKATVSFNGEERQINRTTTTEIKGVGSSAVEVPEEVAKKLEAAPE